MNSNPTSSSSSVSLFLDEHSITDDQNSNEDDQPIKVPKEEITISPYKISCHLVLSALFYATFLSIPGTSSALKISHSFCNLIYFLATVLINRHKENSTDFIEQLIISKRKAKYEQRRILHLLIPIGILVFLTELSKFYIFLFTIESGNNVVIAVALVNIDIVIYRLKNDFDEETISTEKNVSFLFIVFLYFFICIVWLNIEFGIFILLLAVVKIITYYLLDELEASKAGRLFSRRIFLVDGALGAVLLVVVITIGIRPDLPTFGGWIKAIFATCCYGLIFDVFRFFNK